MVVQDIMSVFVVVPMKPPAVLTKRCGKTDAVPITKDQQQNLRNLKYDVTPAPYGANWLILPWVERLLGETSDGWWAGRRCENGEGT